MKKEVIPCFENVPVGLDGCDRIVETLTYRGCVVHPPGGTERLQAIVGLISCHVCMLAEVPRLGINRLGGGGNASCGADDTNSQSKTHGYPGEGSLETMHDSDLLVGEISAYTIPLAVPQAAVRGTAAQRM
ncbi:hypothetical protein [Streptomyces sp. NBC_01294]|uniref:hypothetical protein n=1 Tax=Streptomyces sp. NBC_01294 TaxID=2903815 RepID=UPI002DDB6680|nr:hypothetical protein [Streptomyces sp. NBC_01294]WRZ61057.1 hypothetical protein OG534_33900 [Streptomyces sp. NBC_01294]